MITDRERQALADGANAAAANGHELGPVRELSAIAVLSCRRCPDEIVLLKGKPDLYLSGQALKRPCSGAAPDVPSLPAEEACAST